MEIELRDYQHEGIRFLQSGNKGLSFEQGLGKTVCALKALKEDSFLCLVVSPLTATGVWRQEIKKHGFDFKVAVSAGEPKKRRRALDDALSGTAQIVTKNFDTLAIDIDKLKTVPWKTIILDESHRIKNRKSKTSEAAHALSRLPSVKNRWILSGTPMPKNVEDLWSQIYFIDPNVFGSWWGFRARYCQYRRMTTNGRSFEVYAGVKNNEELQRKLSGVMLRKTKAENLNLPDKIYSTIPLDMPSDIRKVYDEIKNGLAASLTEGGEKMRFGNHAAAFNKLHQLCQGFIYTGEEENSGVKRFGDPVKWWALEDILDDTEGESVIVFSNFKADEDFLEKKLSERSDRDFFHITGKMSSEEREDLVSRFQNCERPAVFLGNIERCKESITLTKASHVIYYDNSWSYGTRAQSEDRAHRHGQKKTVIYYDIIIDNSVDERIQKVLNMKKEVAMEILGDSQRLASLLLT